MTNIEMLENTLPIAPLKLIAMESCKPLGQKVNDYIVSFRENTINEVTESPLYRNYKANNYQVDRLCPAPGCRIEVCEFPGVEHYHYFDSRMHGRRSCIQHPKEDFLVIMADLRLGNGKLLVAWEADKIVGMAFTVMGDDTLYIKELLADTDAVQDTLLYEAAHIYKVQRMDYFIPSSADTLFLGMARVIRAEELLKVFAHKYPASELYIHIEGDEAIQENNGYYTVRDGFCFRERVPEKKYHTYTLDGFTRLLLEAEHPYMSLMLN